MLTLFSIATRRALIVLGFMFTASANAQSAPPLSVTDPAAPAPALHYESAFSGYGAQQDAPTEVTVRKPEGHMGHDMQSSGRKVTLDNPVQLTQANTAPASAPTAASDTHGRIEAINQAEGKVKLKHGPIPKFDMPGMTMVFRVQDPKLLKQIKVGDEVGVTMEQSGSAIVITGFQK